MMNGEVVFFQLFDVGRYIDLNDIQSIFPGIRDKKIIKTKDTPDYIIIPETIRVEIEQDVIVKSNILKNFKAQIKLYEDGVISFIIRIDFVDLPLERFHSIRNNDINTPDGTLKIENWIKLQFNKIYERSRDYIDFYFHTLDYLESEKYTCYCITDAFNDPNAFIRENEKYLASFLIGENPELDLHQNQIDNTLENSFSFLKQDIAIFDFDRCLIIDSTKDYEDLLLIIELANFQRLELRTLDLLLDIHLDNAEDDIRNIFIKSRLLLRRLNKKLGYLFRLRYDFIFILENLENVSKIIGDYYLAQIYRHLGKIFRFKQWSEIIRNRMRILDDIYTTAKSTKTDKLILYLEILLGVVFTLEFILFLLGLY